MSFADESISLQNLKSSVKTQFSNFKVFEQLNLNFDNSNDITV